MDRELLMVGDWVLFHDKGWNSDGTEWHEDRICQVLDIGYNPRLTWFDEEGVVEEWPHGSYGDIEPIPLTPEILKKNGFNPLKLENHIETVYCLQDISRAIADEMYALWPEKESFYLVLRVDGKDMIRMDVHYIHQLQHALRLCGIEKTIEL